MLKVAVLGANGQVGAELCLLLARVPDVELVPIARTRTGSAFLRWHGIRCRHGRAASAEEAYGLISDCDVIVNSALASGTPAQMRRTEDAIVRNAFACSSSAAVIIHFSTQSVYGDPRQGKSIRWRSLYGRAKLATEKRVRAQSRRHRKRAYILRLGHVCGPLQQISNNIRQEIREDRVVLGAIDLPSNTVYTATIVEAILAIIRGRVAPGCYDLMNVPQWTWRTVYEYEARACGCELHPRFVAGSAARRPFPARMLRWLAAAGGNAVAGSFMRQLVAAGLARLPPDLSERAQAWWYCKRARSEIAALSISPTPTDHLTWVANGKHFIDSLPPTSQVLDQNPYEGFAQPPSGPWSEDLRAAESVSGRDVSILERTS